MIIYLIGGKPHISVSQGFQPIDYQTYYQMAEQGEIDYVEEIFND